MSLNNIKEIYSEKAKEKYHKVKHKSGLTIYMYPKKGYNSNYAIFGTKYGSINNIFSLNDGEKIKVPDGIAHYLEHKLFEDEEGDAFDKYAKTGASANAYTSFDKTCYLFSTTENFKESLEILLDLVQKPYFTPETVEKEQGIIGQEIKMYEDSPDWRVFFNLLGALYHNHPVKIDIAGTVKSIAEITAEKLYETYNVFYNLNNMVLCVCGGTDLKKVLDIIDNKLKTSPKEKITNYFEDEPYTVNKEYIEEKLPVSVELFNLGFKEKASSTVCNTKELAEIEILLYILASETSILYNDLMDNNLINASFGYDLFEGTGYKAVTFSGESRKPKETANKIKEHITALKENGFSEEDFSIAKKAVYGDSISSLNSVENIGNMIVDFHFSDREIYEYIDDIANVSYSDVKNRLKSMLDVNNSALSVIKS